MSDYTIQVYEPQQRNSGIVGGKWLQRTKLTNPDTGRPFQASDFEVGKILTINCHKFQLDQATEFAMSYMESDPDDFPQADLYNIVTPFQHAIKARKLDPKLVFDQNSTRGRMNTNQLIAAFQSVGIPLSQHQALTIMRRYQVTSEPNILTSREFLQFAQ